MINNPDACSPVQVELRAPNTACPDIHLRNFIVPGTAMLQATKEKEVWEVMKDRHIGLLYATISSAICNKSYELWLDTSVAPASTCVEDPYSTHPEFWLWHEDEENRKM